MHRTMPVKGFVLILALMLIVFMTLHLVLRGDVSRKAEQEKALQIALAKLERENKDLKSRMESVGTDDYIAASAMQNYAYVNKDDIRFEFADPMALYAYTKEEQERLAQELAE